jgi:hypothetical protein
MNLLLIIQQCTYLVIANNQSISLAFRQNQSFVPRIVRIVGLCLGNWLVHFTCIEPCSVPGGCLHSVTLHLSPRRVFSMSQHSWCSDISNTEYLVSTVICFQHMVYVTSSQTWCCWCYVHEIYPTAWYRDYFGHCERIHLFSAAFMKLYFLIVFCLYVVFVGIYGNLCDAAVGYSDSDGSVLHISRTFTSACFHFGCIEKM